MNLCIQDRSILGQHVGQLLHRLGFLSGASAHSLFLAQLSFDLYVPGLLAVYDVRYAGLLRLEAVWGVLLLGERVSGPRMTVDEVQMSVKSWQRSPVFVHSVLGVPAQVLEDERAQVLALPLRGLHGAWVRVVCSHKVRVLHRGQVAVVVAWFGALLVTRTDGHVHCQVERQVVDSDGVGNMAVGGLLADRWPVQDLRAQDVAVEGLQLALRDHVLRAERLLVQLWRIILIPRFLQLNFLGAFVHRVDEVLLQLVLVGHSLLVSVLLALDEVDLGLLELAIAMRIGRPGRRTGLLGPMALGAGPRDDPVQVVVLSALPQVLSRLDQVQWLAYPDQLAAVVEGVLEQIFVELRPWLLNSLLHGAWHLATLLSSQLAARRPCSLLKDRSLLASQHRVSLFLAFQFKHHLVEGVSLVQILE